MRMQFVALLLFCLVSWIPVALSQQDSSPPEDQDSSGDDLEISGSGSGDEGVISSDFGVELHTNTTPSLAPYLENTPVSLTTGPNHAVVVEPEGPVVSQAPPTTPDEQEEVQEQPISVYPIGREKDATPVPTEAKPITKKVFQETDTPHSPTTFVVTTAAAAVVKNVEVASKNTTAVVVEDLPPAKTTSLAITTTTLSQAIVPHITPGMPAFNVRDTVATPAPSSVQPNDSKSRRMNEIHEEIVPEVATGLAAEGDTDIVIEPDVRLGVEENAQSSSENQSLLDRKEVLAGVVAGGVVGLAFAVMLVSLMVYRMKKKDEGSYALDEHKHPNAGYQKPQRQEEFLA